MHLQRRHKDQQYQFGQSDYVEAVEGRSAGGEVEYLEEFEDDQQANRDGFDDEEEGEESCGEQMEEDEYIEEEQEMTLDEFYA